MVVVFAALGNGFDRRGGVVDGRFGSRMLLEDERWNVDNTHNEEKAKPISADPATTFEGFTFEDLYYPGKVWPRSCRILKPMELMDMEDEVVVSNSGYHVGN
ncbi:hypothetical protein SO802_017313 [Lithocarpus litseifolius]|uniref:Uncharacterized protein n=1 Tax=Lithocarpus litseifolius TaxID=425828 RepID=A0AAW2CYY3_9ROSI